MDATWSQNQMDHELEKTWIPETDPEVKCFLKRKTRLHHGNLAWKH
jgi:hypothetical protein